MEHQLYRFIKASERLPEDKWTGIIRWTDSAEFAIISKGNFYDNNIYGEGELFVNQKDIEWLEEIQGQAVLPISDEEVNFATDNKKDQLFTLVNLWADNPHPDKWKLIEDFVFSQPINTISDEEKEDNNDIWVRI